MNICNVRSLFCWIRWLISGFIIFSLPSVHAATFTVTSNADSGAGSLRNIVAIADVSIGADTIIFDAILNNETITLTTGQIDIVDAASLIIDASGLDDGVTISGNDASRIFGVTSTGKLTLNNVVITNGFSSVGNGGGLLDCSDGGGTPSGGAICAEGSLELIDSMVTLSRATGLNAQGGGFYAAGNATLMNSTVSQNTASGGGGGFYVAGRVRLTHSNVSHNFTTDDGAPGGGFVGESFITLTNSVISENGTRENNSNGGGVSDGGAFNGEIVTIENTTISFNSTLGISSQGGALSFQGNGVLITNSTITGNNTQGAESEGGGLFFVHSDVDISNSTITANSAFHMDSEGDGMVVISGIQENSVTVISSIMSGNGANNTLVVMNNQGYLAPLNMENSLFGDGAGEITGTNVENIFNNVPGLIVENNNGCAMPAGKPSVANCVETHRLLSDSPAIDKGRANNFLTDQRGSGYPRVIDGQADIGAYEGAFKGDCTGENVLNIQDVICAINRVLGDGVPIHGEDMDNDGDVDIQDVIAIINRVLSL